MVEKGRSRNGSEIHAIESSKLGPVLLSDAPDTLVASAITEFVMGKQIDIAAIVDGIEAHENHNLLKKTAWVGLRRAMRDARYVGNAPATLRLKQVSDYINELAIPTKISSSAVVTPFKSAWRSPEAQLFRKVLKERGLCHDSSTGVFYRPSESDLDVARDICQSCPVQMPCAEYSLLYSERDGMWAGITQNGHKRVKKMMESDLGITVEKLRTLPYDHEVRLRFHEQLLPLYVQDENNTPLEESQRGRRAKQNATEN